MFKGIALSVVVIVAVFAAVFIWCGGDNILIFVDIPSFLVVPVGALAYMLALKGPRGLGAAFRSVVSKDSSRAELEGARAFFKSLMTAAWLFGIIGSLFGITMSLRDISQPERVGPNLAVSILTLLYAAFFNAVVSLPFLSKARERLAEGE